MILDERQSAAFRKTINSFMPKQVNSKMVFQCLPLPEGLTSIRKIHRDMERQVDEERLSIGTLRVTGQQMNNQKLRNKRIKSNNTKARIKTIRVVMDNPERLVNTLVDSQERRTMLIEDDSPRRLQIKTPKQILTSHNSQQHYYQSVPLEPLDDLQFYQQLILENPLLFKKVIQAYNVSKRQTEKQLTKIQIRKAFNRKQQTRSLSRPRQIKIHQNLSPENKKFHLAIQYKEFQLATTLSNRLFVVPPQEVVYRAYVCRGNNGLLIKNLIKSRPWWSIRTRGQMDSCNLVWSQWKRTRPTNNLPSSEALYSLGENSSQRQQVMPKMRELKLLIEKKEGLLQKCLHKQDNLWKYLDKTANQNYLTFGKKLIDSKIQELATLVTKNNGYRMKRVEKDEKMFNHVPGCLSLHSKKLLFYNLKQHYKRIGKDIFSVVPLTFHITKGVDDPEFLNFCQYYDSLSSKKKGKSQKNIWIIKPGQNSNRGNGITVTNNLAQIRSLVSHKISPHRSLIIQKYCERPFLYNKRKFDIRCYILITCLNGIVKSYWYEQGYLRTTSKEYSLKNLENKFVHLTNDAIQKKGEEYGKFENFNKISYQDFEKYLQSNHADEQFKFSDTLSKMKSIATDLICSVGRQLNSQRKEYCFEIFGLDFILDQKLNPFLIEANSNPCIAVDGNVLARVIPAMLEGAFRIAVDPVFPPPLSQFTKNKYSFSNSFQANRWQLIYDSYFDQEKFTFNFDMEVDVNDELPENEEEVEE